MKRRSFMVSAIAAGALLRNGSARAVASVARIGWLTAQRAPSLAPFIDQFRAGLADLGYREGQNLVIEFRYGDDAIDRVPALAKELVQLPVDLIVAQGAAVPVINALGLPLPVVYVFSGDPISAGFADSLNRPRGNMTGLTFMAAELNGKRLELLREILPKLHRVAIVANPEHPGEQLERAYSEQAGHQLGLTTEYFPTPNSNALTAAFAAMAANPPEAISLFADGFAIQNAKVIISFAMSEHVPVVSGWPFFAKGGALFTYGPRLDDSYRRLAYYVDRVLKGARTADLPIERPTTFELVVNLQSAKALGLTIPPSILAVADKVIE